MKKIGIINCYDVSKRCCATGCFKAFNNKTGSFERYKDVDAQIASFTHCNGCDSDPLNTILTKAKKMHKLGVNVFHLSTCIKTKCPFYEDFIRELSKEYDIEIYTH